MSIEVVDRPTIILVSEDRSEHRSSSTIQGVRRGMAEEDQLELLASLVDRLTATIQSVRRMIEQSSGMWAHDGDFVDRAFQLAGLVDSSLRLAGSRDYRSALVLARTGIEHQAIDSLLLLGTKRVLLVDDEDLDRVESELAHHPRILEIARTAGNRPKLRIVEEAARTESEEQISFYYWAADEFTPGFLNAEIEDWVVSSRPELHLAQTLPRLYERSTDCGGGGDR